MGGHLRGIGSIRHNTFAEAPTLCVPAMSKYKAAHSGSVMPDNHELGLTQVIVLKIAVAEVKIAGSFFGTPLGSVV